MRSLGIPVGMDMVLHSPDQANRHFWSFLIDEQGNSTEFTLWEEPPVKNHNAAIEKKRGKVYRVMFSAQDKFLQLKKFKTELPPLFDFIFYKDVSSEYFKPNSIPFSPEETGNNNRKIRYLSVFDINGWQPVD